MESISREEAPDFQMAEDDGGGVFYVAGNCTYCGEPLDQETFDRNGDLCDECKENELKGDEYGHI